MPRGYAFFPDDGNESESESSTEQGVEVPLEASKPWDKNNPPFPIIPLRESPTLDSPSTEPESSSSFSFSSSSLDVGDASSEDDTTAASCAERWRHTQEKWIVRPIQGGLGTVAVHAARHPWKYVLGIVLVSLCMIVTGYFTNFQMENGESELWTPIGSRTASHRAWFANGGWTAVNDEEESEEEEEEETRRGVQGRGVTAFLHSNGENMVSVEAVRQLFYIVDSTLADYPEYSEYCAVHGAPPCPEGFEFVCQFHGIPVGPNVSKVCRIAGPTTFWLNNATLYDKLVISNRDVGRTLSVNTFPGEYERFTLETFVGFPEYGEDGVLTSGKSFITLFDASDSATNFSHIGDGVLDTLLQIRDDWNKNESNPYTLELLGYSSLRDEVQRAIVEDLPLLPLVFAIMTVFTCIAFSKLDWINSHSLLGFGAVVCIVLSLMTGYGLLFLCGVPLTTLTQLLPFVIFGIGLDDSFILTHAYSRTDPRKDPVDRIRDTMDEAGMSIFMTTATSTCAFALGCFSSLPAIRWLCLYAFPLVMIDFVYQITFFMALVILDQKRVDARRRDCLVCFTVKKSPGEAVQDTTASHKQHIVDRAMSWYADKLMNRWVKGFVIVFFLAFLGVCSYSATQLRLDFSYTTFLSSDSYVIPFLDALDTYGEAGEIEPWVYFRNVDQSDPEVRAQMEAYIDDLAALDFVAEPPNFWIKDFNLFFAQNEAFFLSMPFKEMLNLFLEEERYERYESAFRYDADGNIRVSRTQIEFPGLNLTDVDDVLRVFRELRRVERERPLNQGVKNWPFFSHNAIYSIWEFLSITLDELKLTTILGIVAVAIMGALFLPHWTGVLLVGVLITVLYADLLGMLQFAGITINGVTYVALTMSIGLLVDFVMHIAHQYFTSTMIDRESKTKDVLRTMGPSVLLGGLSTFLGTLPLAFASVDVFHTVFVTFVCIVLLGLSHGLILLPVVLSLIGPESWE